MAETFFQRRFERVTLGDFAHADAGTFTARLDDQRQAQGLHAGKQRRFLGTGILLAVQRDIRRHRQAHRLPHHFGAPFIHGQRRSHHTAAGIRQLEELQHPLQGAVFAAATVQRDKDFGKPVFFQLGYREVTDINAVGIDTGFTQPGQHGGAGLQ
ncbi:hypothetical protein D3C80_1420910 [compost metagenome]